MDRTQNADVLNYPLHENAKFGNTVDSTAAADFSDSSFLSNRSNFVDRSYNASSVKSNSSPHRYEPSHHHHFEDKKAKALEQISGHELMRQAGIGRGKHRARNSPVNDVVLNSTPECKSISIAEGPLNSVEFPELKSVKTVCNIEGKKTVNLPMNDQSESVLQNNGMAINEQRKPNDHKDMRNTHNTMDGRFREHDYRRLQNGVDSTNKNYNKSRNYKLNFHTNGASAVHYNRTLTHFQLPPNIKAIRTMNYRQNDPRRNQSSKPSYANEINKLMYAKHRPNMCVDKEITAYDTNRNLAHFALSKNDINSHMQLSEPYISHVNPALRRRPFVNKMDSVNTSKQWSNNNRIYSDANTSTAVCHRAAVPSNKFGHTGNLDKDNCTFVSKTDSSDSKTLGPEMCATTCDKELVVLKGNCSPLSLNQYSNTSGTSGVDSASNSSKTSPTSLVNFPPVDAEQSTDVDYSHYHSSVDDDLVNKSLCDSGPLRCNSQRDKLSSHPQSNEYGNLPDQPLASDTDTMQASVTFNSSNGSSSMGVSVVQASYADIIRSPAIPMNKIALSPVFHPSNTLIKTDATLSLAHDVQISDDIEPLNSSEWIISRLSQVNIDGVQNVNGMTIQQASAANHSLQSRPIAVSVEKPSFYNSKNSLQSSLTSPEKRMLDCQMVEEHLCNILTSKASDEKLSFLSELPITSPNSACANARTDSLFSDSSSVCSSASSTLKIETQRQPAEVKASTAPVIIMKNCMPLSVVSDISFGIELDEIMQICSDNPGNMRADSASVSDSDASLAKPSSDVLENCTSGDNLRYVTIGGKKLLWREKRLDVNKCNMGHIVDYMHNAWQHVETASKKALTDLSDGIKYYTCE